MSTVITITDSDDDNLDDPELTQAEKLFTDCEFMRRYIMALLFTILQVIWATWMAAAAMLKIIEYGMYQYVMHYTNWSWTLQIFFYFGSLAVPFILAGLIHPESRLGQFTQLVVIIGFLPLNGVLWGVMVLVNALLGTNSPFLTNVFTQLTPSIVMLGNELFHVWPVLVILIYYIVYRKFIHYSYNSVYASCALLDCAWRLVIFLFYEGFFGTVLSAFTYGIIFDPCIVYSSNLPISVGIGIGLVTLVFVNLVPLLIVVAIYNVGSRTKYPYLWLLLNENDPDTWVRMHMGGQIKDL
jgi:hypothetical protein